MFLPRRIVLAVWVMAAALIATLAFNGARATTASAQTAVPTTPAPRPPPDVAAALAHTLNLPTPVIGISPAPPIAQLVNAPTWLWLQPPWRPVTATAPPGGTTVTAVAQPTAVVFDMGNGENVTCGGPGVPYNPLLPGSAQQTNCSYTYRKTSAGQPGDRFSVTATLYWQVSWLSSNDPTPHALGPMVSRSAPVAVRVAEAGSLNLAPPPPPAVNIPGGVGNLPSVTSPGNRPNLPAAPTPKKDGGGIWGFITHAPGAVWGVVKQAPGALWDGTKAVGGFAWGAVVGTGKGIWSGLNFTKDVVVGLFEGGWSFVHGLISIGDGISKLLFLHGSGVAIKTWKGLVHGVKTIFTTNPLTTLKAIGSGLIKPMVDEWKAGHPGKAIGRGVFEILALVAGTKGLDKLNDLRKAGKGAELLTEAEKAAEAERAAKLAEAAAKGDAAAWATKESVESYVSKLSSRVTPNNTAADAFEIAQTGPVNYTVSGGGATVTADGIDTTSRELLEAKFTGDPANSPYIQDSKVPQFLKDKVRAEQADEFRRYAAVVRDSANPFKGVRVIVNDPRLVPYFEQFMKQYNVPGRIVVSQAAGAGG